jgi:hypothetical protein
MYKIVFFSIFFLGAFSNATLANDNLRTCLSGKYHSLCNYSALTPEQRKQATEARRLENLKTCLSGKYSTLCNHSLLSATERKDVVEAEKQENLRTCMSGKYKTLCKHHLLSQTELQQVKEAERQENLKTCLNGSYASLCNHSILTKEELSRVSEAEKRAADKARKIQTSPTYSAPRRARDGYLIEVAHNDELFIINGEKYEAQTYCLGWDEGDEVIFVEGSAFGACASAKLYNMNRRESCDVWCE